MTVLELGAVLNGIVIDSTTTPATTMKFSHFAWSHAPAGDYGVYAEDTAMHHIADNHVVEQIMQGTIDYYTRDDTATPKTKIQNALTSAGVFWYLNSIQYENDTGYIHYEWVFDVNG